MKAIFTALVLLTSLSLSAQRTFHYGISLGVVSNSSKFASGMEEANAIFNHSDHGAGVISFNFEKDIDERFSVQAALSFTELGYTYSLEKNYSLKRPFEKYTEVAPGNCIGQIPVFINYRTKLNCRNNRWFIGAGPQLMYSGDDYENTTESAASTEGSTSMDKLTARSTMNSFATISLAGQAGIEHLFEKGYRLRWAFIVNHGFSELGYSDVEYSVKGTTYTHTFTNSGRYAGFYVSWYFR